MFLTIGTTPAAQRVMVFRKLTLDAVNRAVTTLDGVAGKAINVAKVLKALGENPVALGFVGGPRGETIRAAMAALGIAADFIQVSAPTRQCITVIDETTGMHTELVEESRAVEPAAYDALMANIQRQANVRAAIMSGTITPGGPVDFYARCIQWANQAGAITAVDAQGALLMEALKARPGLVKPNRHELAATIGQPLDSEAQLCSAMRTLAELGAQRVVITAGAAATLAFDGCAFWKITSPKIKAVNPIGSGDAFTAGCAARLVRGDDLGEACRWGAACGAANALTWMAGEVTTDEVARLAKEVSVERLG